MHTTIGFGWPPPGSARPKVELIAIGDTAEVRLLEALLSLADLVEHSARPVRIFHKVSYAEAMPGLPSRYFLLDGGLFGFGYDSQRLAAIPVTGKEYDEFVVRDDLPNGEQPQALRILNLPRDETTVRDLPANLLGRWKS